MPALDQFQPTKIMSYLKAIPILHMRGLESQNIRSHKSYNKDKTRVMLL